MKTLKILTLAVAICAGGNVLAQKAQLDGEIKGMGNGELTIRYYEGTETKNAKVNVIQDKFTWTAAMLDPQKVLIRFPKRAVWIYAEPGKMQLRGHIDSLSNIKVSGSKMHQESEVYTSLLEPFLKQESLLYRKYGKVSKEEQLILEQQLDKTRVEKRRIANNHIVENPESAFSLSLVTDRAAMGEYDDIKSIYDKLGNKIKTSSEGQRLTDRLSVLKRSSIGSPILNFTQNDVNGQPVSFSAFKGKYVLIDFWASWCGPCRAENPNVLKLYNKYKDNNFTVLGISLDDKGDNWKKAIADDGMPWTQLSDLKGWKNDVSTYYGIMAIPSTLLVDPKGNIIAKDLRGEILNEKLSALFDK